MIDALRRRCVAEFAIAQSKQLRNEATPRQWLVKTCTRLAMYIVRCFTGDHSKCARGLFFVGPWQRQLPSSAEEEDHITRAKTNYYTTVFNKFSFALADLSSL